MHVRLAKSAFSVFLAQKDLPTRTGATLYTVGEAPVRDDKDNVTHHELVTHLLVPSSGGWLHVMVAELSEDDLKAMTTDILKVDEIAG